MKTRPSFGPSNLRYLLDVEPISTMRVVCYAATLDNEKEASLLNYLIPSCKKCNHSKKSNNLEDWYKEQIFYKKENLEKIKK